jgi:MFS transporter, DHA1 family, tetracycline resistance protein
MAILFLIVFIDLIGFGIIIPLLPYYGLRFAATPFEITLLMACYSLAQLVSAPLLGRLSDRIGRRPVLLLSLACAALSYAWLGAADALWMLFAARLMAGAGAGNIAAAQAYIADVTAPEARARGMGLIGAAFGLGFTLGPWIGGTIAGDAPGAAALARPAFVAAGFSALAFLLVLALLRESRPAGAAGAAPVGRLAVLRQALARRGLRRLVLLLLATVAAFAAMETTFALWANETFGWGPLDVGRTFFYVGIVLAATQGFIGVLSRRLGERLLVVAGAAIIAVGLLSLPLALSVPRILIVCGLLALGMGLLNPSLSSLVSRAAGKDERGGVMGIAQSASSLARVLGPAVAGPLFQFAGRNAPFLGGALVMALVVAGAWPLLSRAPIEAERAS